MPRWDDRAEERLRDAALALFTERGYDDVTVAEITERAGLTRRTFSRYFADKRDVLFAGSDQLPPALAAAVRDADPALGPFEALLVAIVGVGEQLVLRLPHAASRRDIIRSSAELQERERTKFAAVADAVAEALAERGGTRLLVEVGVAVFRTAYERWIDRPDEASFRDRVREAADELAAALPPR
jgi:AcrR family transcriptional regulator